MVSVAQYIIKCEALSVKREIQGNMLGVKRERIAKIR
jgi:hypothetical protein